MVKTAEMGNGDDLAGFDRRDFSRYRGVPAEREMGSGAIVVPDVLLHASPKVALVQYDQVVDALPPNRANNPLRIGVLPR